MGDVSQLLQFLFSGLTTGSIYALIAVSLVIVYKVSLLICFAQGEFFVIGALTMATLVSKGSPHARGFRLVRARRHAPRRPGREGAHQADTELRGPET